MHSINMQSLVEIITPLKDYRFVDTFREVSSENHFWFRWRFKAFLRQLRDLKVPIDAPLKVMDVGAGPGVLRDQIETHTEWTVDLTDLDYASLELANPGRGSVYYYDVNERRAEWRERYDAVLIFDVLEHVKPTREFLESLLFHLRPGAFLFVNVPALPVLFSRFDTVQGHFRRYNRKTLAGEFDGLGAEILDIRYWGTSNLPPLLLRKLWL
ncbi:MAG: class I SAM-dependent methyltransferase, partial [Acidobacteria bacterium]|nr:class I SAM-dependent methyltransferase [Acidobacteriota bacterium]